MRITHLLALVLALGLCRTASATAQAHEIIHVNGRVLTMQTTPLAPLVEGREDLKEIFEPTNSGCWRGYVGTWSIEGDRLYLVALEREEYAEREVKIVSIPMSAVFGAVAAPVPATWYTGTLRIPLTARGRYVHMGFGTIHDRELRVGIRHGIVVSQAFADARNEGRGRSEMDLSWCSMPSVLDKGLPPDDGAWTDARALREPRRAEGAGEGTVLRTRGILDRDDDGRGWTLWIPQTLVTPDVVIPLRGMERVLVDGTWPRVELEATWHATDAALAVRWFRRLLPGETIHHPAFPLPELPAAGVTEEDGSQDEVLPLRSAGDVAGAFGTCDHVRLHGPLLPVDAGTAAVLGVDVQNEEGLLGKDVEVTGFLEKWVVTERLLRVNPPEIAPFRTRGVGTYYRLVEPHSGRLATPRPGNSAK